MVPFCRNMRIWAERWKGKVKFYCALWCFSFIFYNKTRGKLYFYKVEADSLFFVLIYFRRAHKTNGVYVYLIVLMFIIKHHIYIGNVSYVSILIVPNINTNKKLPALPPILQFSCFYYRFKILNFLNKFLRSKLSKN